MLAAPIFIPVAVGGCALLHRRRRPVTPPPVLHTVLGPPYQINGVWRYPHASYEYDEAGLASIVTTHAAWATDGAPWNSSALMAAHPTLQLPAVLRVTNLESGRQILLRLDDRGPSAPGRLLALTPRAAELLGTATEPGVLRVRLVVEQGPSRQLTAELGDVEAPALALTAAPTATVRTEALGLPGFQSAAATPPPMAPMAIGVPSVPLRLPESILMVPVMPTSLWIDAAGLGSQRYAEVLRARLGRFGAIVAHDPAARSETAWRVRVGPLPGVAAADAMLDRMLAAGVVDARIIVV